jgi:fumarate reductase subunit C
VSFRLYILQRLTAALMLPLIVAHIAAIVYATRHGLSAADILSRTRGAIGLRVVVSEWTGLRGLALEAFMIAAGLLLAALGARAVYAVTA